MIIPVISPFPLSSVISFRKVVILRTSSFSLLLFSFAVKLASGQPSVKLQLLLLLKIYQTSSGAFEVILLADRDRAKGAMDKTQLYTKMFLPQHFNLSVPNPRNGICGCHGRKWVRNCWVWIHCHKVSAFQHLGIYFFLPRGQMHACICHSTLLEMHGGVSF